MNAPTHPSQGDLLYFSLGRLPVAESESVASHISDCLRCQNTVARLDALENTVLEALRRPQQTMDPAEEAGVAEAIDRAIQAGVQGAAAGSAERPRDEPGEAIRIGSYELLDVIGRGGMGAVYRARQAKLGRFVGLKLLPPDRVNNPERLARFEREMRAIGALEHNNIVRAYDAGEAEGRHYLAMELVDGVDLRELVRQEGILPTADACEIIRQAACGLAHAHERGLVHRDVKPSNLMLNRSGVVKLLDLGLASMAEAEPGALTEAGAEAFAAGDAAGPVTTSGQLVGTVDFMAPEQCLDVRTVGPWSDLFSLGGTLYFLLTARPPYAGRDYATVGQKIAGLTSKPVPDIAARRPDLPAALLAALGRMLAKDPADRYPSAAEAAAALTPLAAGSNLARYATASSPAVRAEAGAAATIAGPTQTVELAGGGHRPLSAPWRVLAAAAGGAAALAAVLATISTSHGTLTVDVPPEARQNLRIEVSQDGEAQVVDAKAGWSIELDEGVWKVDLKTPGDKFTLDKDEVTIRRREEAIVHVALRDAAASEREDADGESQEESTAVATEESSTAPLAGVGEPPEIVLADPERAEWAMQCDMYTKAYTIDENGRIKVPNAQWTVMDHYRGADQNGVTTVDDRLTLVLKDPGNGFWPVIAKFSLPAAEKLHAELRKVIKEKGRGGEGPGVSSTGVDGNLYTSRYEIGELGRIQLRGEGIAWKVLPTYSGTPDDDRLALIVVDEGRSFWPVIVQTSRTAAEQLQRELGAAIVRKRAGRRQRVTLETREGYFVRAVLGGGEELTADQRRPQTSEVFTLEWLDEQRTRARMRTREGHYVRAVDGGGAAVDAPANEPKSADEFSFEWLDVERTRARVRTREGYYLHPERGGGGGLDARVKEPATSEIFKVAPAR